MHHYTYLITYKNGLKYMGVRSSEDKPEEDNYYGSSKHTPDVSEVVTKEILGIYPNRSEALQAEIAYHSLHDVGVNPLFLNRSKQTSVKFDTTGITFAMEANHKEAIRAALTGRKRSEAERLAISKGKAGIKRQKHSEETKLKIGLGNKGKIVSETSINKMVSTRMSNNSYVQSEETKNKIKQSLLINPPNTAPVVYTINGVISTYPSVTECSRQTGIKLCSLKARLNRIPGKVTNGWSIDYLNEQQITSNESN